MRIACESPPPRLSPWRVLGEYFWTLAHAPRNRGLGLEALTFHPDGGEGVPLPFPDLPKALEELARRYPHAQTLEVRVGGEPLLRLTPQAVAGLLAEGLRDELRRHDPHRAAWWTERLARARPDEYPQLLEELEAETGFCLEEVDHGSSKPV